MFSESVSMEDIDRLISNLDFVLDRYQLSEFIPSVAKHPPAFTQHRLGEDLLCQKKDFVGRRIRMAESLGLSRGHAARRLKDVAGEADSELNPELLYASEEAPLEYKGRRYWTLAESRKWVKEFSPRYHKRKPNQPGVVITTAHFKKGVSKTMTTACLAQGLSLMGFDILVIDTDGQGSLSKLFGHLATDISFEETVKPIFLIPGVKNYRASLAPSIRQTYWDGVDLVAASPDIFNASYSLMQRELNEPDFQYWNVLNQAIGPDLREKYDFILIDTPPELSRMVVNAMWASDGVIMPITPDLRDVASSAEFWNMFVKVEEQIAGRTEAKQFKFQGILRALVDPQHPRSAEVSRLQQWCFPVHLLSASIPKVQVHRNTGGPWRTIFDITRYSGGAKDCERAVEAWTAVCLEVVDLVKKTMWCK